MARPPLLPKHLLGDLGETLVAYSDPIEARARAGHRRLARPDVFITSVDGNIAAAERGQKRPGSKGKIMRLSKSRIEPVTSERLAELRQELFGEETDPGQRVLNVTRLWGVHPALMKAQRGLQTHVFASTLAPRLRELAILRIGWLCDSGYELAQHAVFGMRAGLDEGDLERVTKGPDEPGWSPLESAVIRAVDEMFEDAFVTTITWERLREEFTDEQIIDLLSVVGRYWTVSVVLNSTGVQLEEDTKPFSEYLSSGEA